MNETIAFIGGGNMARSLIGGLIADGFPADRIRVADPSAEQRDQLSRKCGVAGYAENADAIAGATVVVLAVKPQVMRSVASDLAPSLTGNPLIISVAAGIRSTDLERWLGGAPAVVRCMPNTPALVQCGATGLYANARVSHDQRNSAETILRAVGITQWFDAEEQLDAVTALSGSGPAYYFLMMEAMAAAGEQLGLSADSARLLTLQTAFGAAKMALESTEPPATLRERVTSPGGTTEQALRSFEDSGFRELVARAMQAARDRSDELAKQLGED